MLSLLLETSQKEWVQKYSELTRAGNEAKISWLRQPDKDYGGTHVLDEDRVQWSRRSFNLPTDMTGTLPVGFIFTDVGKIEDCTSHAEIETLDVLADHLKMKWPDWDRNEYDELLDTISEERRKKDEAIKRLSK